MSCSETCDPAGARGSVSSGVCDHNVCQDPKGKATQLGTSQNCTWGVILTPESEVWGNTLSCTAVLACESRTVNTL